MLKNAIEKNLCSFYKNSKDWKDAIIKSCKALENEKIVNEQYSKELISSVEQYGPYIVIEDGIAMPHSTQNGDNVFGTEIAFTKFEEDVVFDEENRAKIFFTLASVNSELHIQNIQKLTEVLLNEELKEELFKVNNIEELKKLSEKYNI